MRFAEITAPRTLLALASVTTLALAGATLMPCPRPAVAKVARTPVIPLQPMRGCAERAQAKAKAEPRPYDGPRAGERHGKAFREVLTAAVPTLASCLPEGIDGPVRLTIQIRGDGQVREAELTDHGVRVADDDIQTCVMAVVSGLAFPTSPHPITLTTHLMRPDDLIRR